MQFHIRTGDLKTKVNAENHHNAAIKALRKSNHNLGICTIVSDQEINDLEYDGNVFFLTQNILNSCSMRLVG